MELRETIESILRAEEHVEYENNDLLKIQLKNIKVLLTIYNNEKGMTPLITSIILNYNNPEFSYLGFEFLIKIKEIKKAFLYLEKSLNKIRNSSKIYFKEFYSCFNKCLGRLNLLIEDTNFKPNEIEEIRDYIFELSKLLPQRHTKLRENYYQDSYISVNHRLRKEIIKKLEIKKAQVISNIYNQDIGKEDINNVVNAIKKLNLSEGISIAFKKLEEKYYQAEDKSEFAMFGGYIRQTLMGLIKEISLRVAKDKSEFVKEKDEHLRNYLKKSGLINEGLWRMIGALYDFLSTEINHSIETDKEYFKIGLNIASQLSYLLLKEYESYLRKNKTI
ncbi:hypothetical protein GOV12_04835 [Candidatus Pacearchaeota archaeon]|nr:hypothetical protein [Candidatus Pacearchaeota archaeon]